MNIEYKYNKKHYIKYLKINQEGGMISEELIDFLKDYGDEVQKFLNIFTTIAAPMAVVASGGLGGDTVIEMATLGFEALIMIKNIIVFKEEMEVLKEKNYFWIVEDMLSFKFSGTNDFEEDFNDFRERIIDEIGEDEYYYVLSILDKPLKKLLSSVASMVGASISTAIPDDGGVTSKLVKTTIDSGINNSISTIITGVDKIYDLIPDFFSDMLEDPKLLARRFKTLFRIIKKFSKKFLRLNPIYIAYTLFGKKFPTNYILDFMIENRLTLAEYINKSFAYLYLFMYIIKEIQENN